MSRSFILSIISITVEVRISLSNSFDHSQDKPFDYAQGKRRGWDSNPRPEESGTAFRERHHRPLGHLSTICF